MTRLLRSVLVAGAAVVLTGAVAFGTWHVAVGGLVRGNARAAEFGVLLAAVAGTLLVGLAVLVRRRR